MMELETHGLSVDRANYELVYTAPFTERMNFKHDQTAILSEVFERFNAEHPADYKGRSVSVSDVIVLNHNGEISSHFVDSVDFVALDGFLGEETPKVATVGTPTQVKQVKEPDDKSVTYSQVGNSLEVECPAAPKTKPTLMERLEEGKRKSTKQDQTDENKTNERRIRE